MDKKFKIAAIAVPFATLTAITIAFAISGKPKAEAGELRPATALTPASASAANHPNKSEKVSSLKAGEDNDGEEDDDEEKEDAPITAKITPDAAKSAALAAQPGTANKVELENEDGQPIYSVDITAADKQKYEVEVDGNTGKVLKSAVEKDDDGPGGDGDGEENDD